MTEEDIKTQIMRLYIWHAKPTVSTPSAIRNRLQNLVLAVEDRVHQEIAEARQDSWVNESLEDVKRKRIDGV